MCVPMRNDSRTLVAAADVVLDCSDNFATRHALNRACSAIFQTTHFGCRAAF